MWDERDNHYTTKPFGYQLANYTILDYKTVKQDLKPQKDCFQKIFDYI